MSACSIAHLPQPQERRWALQATHGCRSSARVFAGAIPSPNEAGIVLVSRHCGDHDGLQLVFEPERIVGMGEIHSWSELRFPVGYGSNGALVLRWDLRSCTRRLLYRSRVPIGSHDHMRVCTHVDLFRPRLLNEGSDRLEQIEFTARSWQEYHTLRGLVILA